MPALTMPNVGEGITEGTVTRWLKQEGDSVERDEPVVEIETDKAVAEIPCAYAGRLARILVPEGETVPVGTALAEIEVAGAVPAAEEPPATEPAREAEPAPAERPRVASSARDDGRGGRNGSGSDGSVPAYAPGRDREVAAPREAPSAVAWYSPAVLRLASEHGIDLQAIEGSGREGRVTRKDVLRHIEERSAAPAATAEVATEAPEGPAEPLAPAAAGDERDGERVALSATRRSIARHMTEAHQTIPVAWMVVEADVTGLVALRERMKEDFQRTEGVALTYLPFCVEAIVGALKQHPRLNASYADDGIDVHRRLDVCIAVATESGLLTPVLRDADRRSLVGLAHELDELARRARERSLSVEELRGGTFTINNTGAFGSIVSQPIVPVGQVAIVTTEAIRRELRVLADGTFGQRSVMNLCISFDHRALDGADVGAFMRDVVERLEAYGDGGR